MCGVPVHSAEVYLHRLIRKGFKVAICEQLEDPGRGPQAAGQAAGPARRGPDRHRRHAHRGRPARPAAQQLAGGTGRERGRARPRPGRHLDRRLRHRTGRPERAGGRTRAPRRRRDPGPGPAAGRARRPLPRGRCRHHAAGGRELRQHRRRAPPVPRLRGRHARRARRVRPGRAGGGRRHPGLSRADAERGFAPPRPAAARRAQEPDADRPGDAAQSRAACEPGSHPRGLAARGDRPHGDQCRRPPPGRTAGGAAGPAGADPGTARRGREPGGRRCMLRSGPRHAAPVPRSRPRAGPAGAGAGRPARPARGGAGAGAGGRAAGPDRGRAGLARDRGAAGAAHRIVPPPVGCARARGPAAGARRRLRPRRPDRRARRAAHAPRPEPPPHRCPGGALSRRDRRSARSRSGTTICWATSSRCLPRMRRGFRPGSSSARAWPGRSATARPSSPRWRAGSRPRPSARWRSRSSSSRSCARRCWRAARPSPARLPPWPSSTCAPGSRRWPPSSAMSGPWSTTATPS